jgi:aldehyde dehydrogenase (NAD(P)+)
VVVLDRDWPLARRFSDLVEQKLASFPLLKCYYVGTADRLAAIKANCPGAKVIGNNNFHFIPDVDANGGGREYMLRNEVFGPAIAFKYLSGNNDARKFWQEAANFANSKCFGSLSLSVAVSPATLAAAGKSEFDNFVYNLNWGTVGVNVWAGFVTTNPFGTWGAPPGRHSIEDIQVCFLL